MKKLFLILTIIFIFPINCFAYSEIVFDMDSGRVLNEVNSNNKQLIASVTKIMTCIIVLENNSLDKKVTVGEEVLKMYGTNIYIEKGEVLTIKDLLYGLMLRSGNDSAITLAINTSGSEEEFVKLMNKKAKEIGMTNTTFNNPHGLDEDTKNYSTATDMAILSRYAYKNKIYREIVKTKKYTAKSSLKSYIWYNRMSLINNYKYCIGGKNGYTPKAGKTLVTMAHKNNLTLGIVTLDDSNLYDNHESLYNKYFSKYKNYIIIDKNNFKIDSNFINEDVYIKKSFKYPLKENELNKVSTMIEIFNNSNNNITGKIIIKYDDKKIGTINVYKRVKEKEDINIFQRFKNLFIR